MKNELFERYPKLLECKDGYYAGLELLKTCFSTGGKLLLCGNGGSCCDCSHIVGELMKGFISKRPIPKKKKEEMKKRCSSLPEEFLNQLQEGLPAISLPDFTGLNTAFANDVNSDLVYAQAVQVLAKTNDVLLCISTSGNSKNVFAAAMVAKALGIHVIGLTGKTGGRLREIADVCICVPEEETYKIQELHLPLYHQLCKEIEVYFFKENTSE